ncbi:MAG: PVC-type heme-binding CxxCH protein [Verrucomicrobiota bacterium]|jgi:putative membrane-bound dehydrogenase-like protein
MKLSHVAFLSRMALGCAIAFNALAGPPPAPASKPKPLFDGKTLEGWEGDAKLWRVRDGCIVGGSLTETIRQNEFLATTTRHTNFVLRVEFRLLGGAGFINSGVQIRSDRVPNSSEMAGYQCDIGEPTWWGSIYDESRRNRVLAWSDMAAIEKVLRRTNWNEYVIRADGGRITTWINGVQGVDYHEPDAAIAAQGGRLGFQVHGGGAAEASFRNITLEELPARKRPDGASQPPNPPHASPLSPEEQQATFSVPEGFVVELVAAEPDGGKFVPMTFDHAGRLWTATALDYPIDANESPAEAKALFARGGKDRILVFDTPAAEGRQRARVFAEGLAMPLGVLPLKDGVLAQYGTEIRLYKDTNGDGRADAHVPLLTGFGIEDSHLFPHQFTRIPGPRSILLAQGAFNSSKVRTTDGKVTDYNRTKLARFRPDGTGFEIVGWGPCNIWGLVVDRLGEIHIQEANDQGWPMMPFLEGASYPLCGDDVPRPYSPPFPKTGEREMGGTGLSGLAFSEGADSFPGPWRDVFFVANPITRKIQAIRLHRGDASSSPGRYGNGWQLEHLPDFLLSGDPWFRPIGLAMGPDGCLYINDWYNQVISHNEVPRNHPERDKLRGRIWRVRHTSQPHRPNVPDLANVPERDLPRHLAAGNTWEANAAWQAIIDRNATSLAPALAKIAGDAKAADDLRVRALWALEGLGRVPLKETRQIASQSPSRSLRKEAVRVLADSPLTPAPEVLAASKAAVADPDRLVRQEGIRSLGKYLDRAAANPAAKASIATALDALCALLAAATEARPSDWSKNPAYFRDFETYLVRVILERHRPMLAAVKPAMTGPEGVALAALVLGGPEGARTLASVLPSLKRPLATDELLLVASVSNDPAAKKALEVALALPATLQLLHDQRARLGDTTALLPLLADAARKLWRNQPTDANADLLLKVASGFRLADLAPEAAAIATAEKAPAARQAAALRALRESGAGSLDVFQRLATSADESVRREAIAALAASKSDAALPTLLKLWPGLPASQRRAVVDRLGSTPASARPLLAAVRSGDIARDEIDGYTLDKLAAVLPDDSLVRELQQQVGSALRQVLRLDGTDNARVDAPIHLSGPFTVEGWFRPDPGLSNADSLLGGPSFDINFYDGRFRVWTGAPHGDVAVASQPAVADAWTHYAVTRDAQGIVRIFLNGRLDATGKATDARDFDELRVGASNAQGGTAGDLAQLRVWSRAMDANELGSVAAVEVPANAPGLVYHGHGGDWGKLGKGAHVERTADFPAIQSLAQAAGLNAKFGKYRDVASKAGVVAQGKAVFGQNCAVCHAVAGQGGKIGPALDGAGAHGNEYLLRNILMPDAAMEAGYRRFRVETQDGEVHEGMLAGSDGASLILRQPGSEDRRFARDTVRRSGFLRSSMMPEGLLEGLPEQQVADLFAYLRTLGGR